MLATERAYNSSEANVSAMPIVVVPAAPTPPASARVPALNSRTARRDADLDQEPRPQLHPQLQLQLQLLQPAPSQPEP